MTFVRSLDRTTFPTPEESDMASVNSNRRPNHQAAGHAPAWSLLAGAALLAALTLGATSP